MENTVSSQDHQRPPQQVSTTGSRIYPFEFTGTGSEFFRIWIVNLFLTIATLGIYAAWAKVRTRRYFFANTFLDGQAFDYLADPKVILRGNLIVAGAVGIYLLTDIFTTTYSVVVILLFLLALPFLIYKSLRFNAHNSAYRNIRFRFMGTAGESYKVYALYALLVPLTLGLIIPYWVFRQKDYFFGRLSYGSTQNRFYGRPGYFYAIYLLAGLITLGLIIGVIIYTATTALMADSGSSGKTLATAGFVILTSMLLFVLIIIVISLLKQFVYARLTNHCLNSTNLGTLRFEGSLKAWELMWIRFTNILAIIFSAGLLIPWARVRRARYIIEHIRAITPGSLEDFAAATETDQSAIGEAAVDFFDIEIGL
ncbi:MAG: DUF898 domain-containing protein [Desulfobacteraceae bacterium]|nr:DUF898 domain-containing protein [Desulfobacteraceae bacterium]MCF8111861.1 DUF898 domain-containing protein [Desulfobacteraceae bacterium]